MSVNLWFQLLKRSVSDCTLYLQIVLSIHNDIIFNKQYFILI